ncbi:hypothetical protein [Maricaulis salignorans]|uniref:hypothetical protein n=1 Tax=Maricaulis salignorans TaxID=144026 RepID=UPI003A8DA658
MRRMILILACLMLAAPAWSQSGDANLRRPGIMSVDTEGGEAQFVVGDAAWGDVLVTLSALRNTETGQSPAIAQQLWERRDINPPFFLFEVARLTVATDPDRALQAYFLGRARSIYDASRCIDSSALNVVGAASEYAGPEVTELMNSDPALLEAALAATIASGEIFTSQASPWWACSYGNAAYFAAVNQADMPGAEWLKVEAVWPALRAAISNNLDANLAMIREGQAASAQ